MLNKSQFKTLFGFTPKSNKTTKASSCSGVTKKGSTKMGARTIKGVKRVVYKGAKGGKYYISKGSKVYFGPAVAKAAAYTALRAVPKGIGMAAGAALGWPLGKAVLGRTKSLASAAGVTKMGTRKFAGVSRTVYKSKSGAKFYKKAGGKKVYFGSSSKPKARKARKATKRTARRTRFGGIGSGMPATMNMMGPYPGMFGSAMPATVAVAKAAAKA